MSAVNMLAQQISSKLQPLVEQAARQIAPAWPLDQMIAVNPWWPKRQQHFATVCAEQQLLAGTSCLMSPDWYLSQWQRQIQPGHLTQALQEAKLDMSTDEAVAVTSDILDDLLARRTVPGRPADLQDEDWAWVRAASGRAEHDDPRLPLIG